MIMTTITIQKRNMNVKAKKLRRDGFIPGVVCGHSITEKLTIQVPEKEAMQLIRENQKGERVELVLDGQKIPAIIKDYSYNALLKHLEVLDFQALAKGEKIHNTVEVILKNETQASGVVTQEISEIHYKAAPEDLLDTIYIDFEGESMKDVKSMKISDLPEFKNPKIFVSNPDAVIFSVTHPSVIEETEETETAE